MCRSVSNMLGNIELNGDTINHVALMLYFANPSFKNPVLLEISPISWKH